MTAVLVWTGRFPGGVLGLSERIHNLVNGSCVPCHTIVLLYNINHFSLLFYNLQPALHNILMDIKGVWDRLGTTCARVDTLGSHGRYKFPVCVDYSVLPYGRCMTMGQVANLILLSRAPGRIKCPVAPASAMAWLTSIFILGVFNRVS